MANIMQMFRAKNKVSRDSYDLSKKLCFTAQAGELLPVYSRILMPGDKFDISVKWKTRTAPVNTAAFTRFREYYDWYFVPIHLLWDKYNTWFTNMKDNNQVATSIKGTTLLTDKHPYFTSQQIENLVYMFQSESENNDAVGRNQFGFRRDMLMKKLLHYLGYGNFYDVESNNNKMYNLELSPWRALAYQKIYQDWHRNSQWEASSPQTYNVNYLTGAEDSLQIPLSRYYTSDDTMFDLRYANWNKDLFMGLLPNSQYGDAASVNLGTSGGTIDISQGATSEYKQTLYISGSSSNLPSSVPLYTSAAQSQYGTNYIVSQSSDSGARFVLSPTQLVALRNSLGLSGSSSYTVESAFTILALRQAEALQKWKEITESNSKDFPSQIEAHYGVKPSNAYSSRSMYLGGVDGTIEIQDIDNTNITENADGSFNGADIAGKGLTRGSGQIRNFSTDVPGVLMCIYHVVPLLDYALGNVAMDNMKTLFTDYAIPEFDKTGMMQVPLAALTNDPRDIRDTSFTPTNGLLGYAPNYIDYKTDIDEVKGAFFNGGLESWVSPITDAFVKQWFATSPTGSTDFSGLDYRFFKVNPSITDPIFAVAADENIDTDKFWTNCYFDIKAVRPLDAKGLPF